MLASQSIRFAFIMKRITRKGFYCIVEVDTCEIAKVFKVGAEKIFLSIHTRITIGIEN